MFELFYIILSNLIISCVSIIGIITIRVNDKTLNKIIILLVAFSAGGLIGGAFLHLLPEAVHESEALPISAIGEEALNIYLLVIAGYLLFFLIEKLLDWHHCHNVEEEHICEFHSFKWLNLIGDGIHNFLDGLVIAASFLATWQLGIITSIAVIAHEIPQEMGDYGVLVYGGFSKKRALYLNFLTALTAVLGGIIGFFIVDAVEAINPFILAFAAGGFIYIAASDLLPELKKEHSGKKTIILFLIVLGGIALLWVLKIFIG